MGHFLAVDRCFERNGPARAYAARALYHLEGTWPHPAEVDVVVVSCPNHDGCTMREPPEALRRSA